MLKYVEICWNTLKYVEIRWNMLKYVEICWNMLKWIWNMLKCICCFVLLWLEVALSVTGAFALTFVGASGPGGTSGNLPRKCLCWNGRNDFAPRFQWNFWPRSTCLGYAVHQKMWPWCFIILAKSELLARRARGFQPNFPLVEVYLSWFSLCIAFNVCALCFFTCFEWSSS